MPSMNLSTRTSSGSKNSLGTLTDFFWKALAPASETTRWVHSQQWEIFYTHGFVDWAKAPIEKWRALLKNLPCVEEDWFLIEKKHLPLIAPFFVSGPIKRPFDPHRLKSENYPLTWYREMYQRVLKFETTLKLAQWEKILDELKKRFSKENSLPLSEEVKEYLQALLSAHPSPLRQLETWVHHGPPEIFSSLSSHKVGPAQGYPSDKSIDKSTPLPVAVADRFESAPEIPQKMRAIEKIYYEESPATGFGSSVDDQEALDFLNELEQLGDPEDSELP